ncbi:hypothetical protein 1 [Hubei odonate virus 12]|uniref:hypothetical protein 1 n=1 Tax=Hubei odonate virus 12 TaxID=1922993 RepID=UPI00090A3581|nr:hypothetical protein 1 [Hubei odonate virus 12]APG76339.1 hypothetical protein 1 [Hubei odonate virus 12]
MEFDEVGISNAEWIANWRWVRNKVEYVFDLDKHRAIAEAEAAEALRLLAEYDDNSFGTHYRQASRLAKQCAASAVTLKDKTCDFLYKTYEALTAPPRVVEVLPWYAPSRLARSSLRWCWQHKVILAGSVVASLIYTGFYLYYRNAKVVRVDSGDSPFEVNTLKDRWELFSRTYNPPAYHPGRHMRLAAERRHVERFIVDIFVTHRMRFRDVGGSRNRWVESSVYKHLCFKEFSGFDILRRQKRPITPFEECGQSGQDCPQRHSIHGAMLVDVDYYMSNDDLAEVVTGPTFIVNHDFARGRQGELGEEGMVEARWHKEGDCVVMTSEDGTPYKHRWHTWSNEGIVVGKNGAFTYVRIGKLRTLQIYYAYPASGVYSGSDSCNLTWGGPEQIFCRNHAMDVFRRLEGEEEIYDIVTPGGTVSITGRVINQVVAQVANLERDNNYYSRVRAFTLSRLIAEGSDRSLVKWVVEVVMAMADSFAYELVRHCNTGMQPDMLTVVDHTRERLRRTLITTLRSFYTSTWLEGLCARRPIARKLTPWVFKDIRMPTYEVYTPPRHREERMPAAAENPFPVRRPPVNAGPDERRGDLPGQHQRQRQRERGIEGASTDSGRASSADSSSDDGDSDDDPLHAIPPPPPPYRGPAGDEITALIVPPPPSFARAGSPEHHRPVENDGRPRRDSGITRSGDSPTRRAPRGAGRDDDSGAETETSYRTASTTHDDPLSDVEIVTHPMRLGAVRGPRVLLECGTKRGRTILRLHDSSQDLHSEPPSTTLPRRPSRAQLNEVLERVEEGVGRPTNHTPQRAEHLFYQTLRNLGLLPTGQSPAQPRRGVPPNQRDGVVGGSERADELPKVDKALSHPPAGRAGRGTGRGRGPRPGARGRKN